MIKKKKPTAWPQGEAGSDALSWLMFAAIFHCRLLEKNCKLDRSVWSSINRRDRVSYFFYYRDKLHKLGTIVFIRNFFENNRPRRFRNVSTNATEASHVKSNQMTSCVLPDCGARLYEYFYCSTMLSKLAAISLILTAEDPCPFPSGSLYRVTVSYLVLAVIKSFSIFHNEDLQGYLYRWVESPKFDIDAGQCIYTFLRVRYLKTTFLVRVRMTFSHLSPRSCLTEANVDALLFGLENDFVHRISLASLGVIDFFF